MDFEAISREVTEVFRRHGLLTDDMKLALRNIQVDTGFEQFTDWGGNGIFQVATTRTVTIDALVLSDDTGMIYDADGTVLPEALG